MITMTGHRRRLTVIIAAAAVLLGLATTAAFAAAGQFGRAGRPFPDAPRLTSCAAPALAGAVVDITLTDMGAMMGPGMTMGPGWNGSR